MPTPVKRMSVAPRRDVNLKYAGIKSKEVPKTGPEKLVSVTNIDLKNDERGRRTKKGHDGKHTEPDKLYISINKASKPALELVLIQMLNTRICVRIT